MRIGLLGGTFDPPHVGHLIVADRCRDDAGLDQVWLVPSFHPPHKADDAVSRFDHRADMAALAVAGQARLRADEVERGLPPPSYTAHTLAALRDLHPGHDFALILGADAVADLPRWFAPDRVVAEAELLVVPRPGADLWDAGRLADAVGVDRSAVRLRAVDAPLVGVSSRDIRARVAAGKSVRFLVPRAVEEYVRERRLYRPDA